MNPFKIDFQALEWQYPLPGARYKVYRAGTQQIRLVEFTSQFVEPHWCEKGHIGMVLSGTLGIDFRGDVVLFPEGTGLFIPAGPDGAHKARSFTPVVRLVLVEEVG